jgi:PTH1 family peptidyl-tRNA hydrolase
MKIKPKIVIGLGNPAKEYANTYHNVGFLFIDYLKSDPKLSPFERSPVGRQTHPNLQILKSETYMNESGEFVAKALKKSGAKPAGLLVIHDDSDIELGKYKLSFGRGSAGHKGIESVIKSLGAKNFWRLRIGIRPKATRKKAEKLVLRKITNADLKVLNQVFEKIIKNSSVN